MTELAYLMPIDAAYERVFQARIVSLPPGGVVLNRTFFYPTGGGQPCDLGVLVGADGQARTVREVVKSGASVVHRLGRTNAFQESPWHVGEELRGEIDWERRHRHMRAHTAQHLVSAVVFAKTGIRTERAAINDRGAYLDLERPWTGSADFVDLARDVEVYLRPARGVEVREVARSAFDQSPSGRSGLVPLPPLVDPVRVILIEGIDTCPCGGTHVRTTGEIGEIHFEPTPPTGNARRVRFTLSGSSPPTPPA
ncbi:MAG: alanyl-tRNA editing protein [Thermoplasmata archaeon]